MSRREWQGSESWLIREALGLNLRKKETEDHYNGNGVSNLIGSPCKPHFTGVTNLRSSFPKRSVRNPWEVAERSGMLIIPERENGFVDVRAAFLEVFRNLRST